MPVGASVARVRFDWTALPSRPVLAPATVHLVCAQVPSDYRVGDDDLALLNPAETARANRFRFDLHRNRWVYGRTRLRRLLGRYLDCEAAAIDFHYGRLGKPALARPAGVDIRFNYTDSGGHLVYALAIGAELGVDVEHLPRPTRYEGLARRKLAAAELDAFNRVPESQRELAFLACWTRKEAWGKALGVGIRYPMRDVTLCRDFSSASECVRDSGRDFRLVQFQPCFDGIACVVAEGAATALVPLILE